MRRRQFIALFGGAAVAWPATVLAQRSASKTIGWLSPRTADAEREKGNLAAFRAGLGQTGYVEGGNLQIEYRWADGQYERLPALAADLARINVALFFAIGGPQPARAAIAASGTIPVVFNSGSDPVKDGLVSSLNKPGGRVTGAVVFTTSLGPKRLELLRELVPAAQLVAFLVNPRSDIADMQVKEVVRAAEAVGQKLIILNAGTDREIEDAFQNLRPRGVDAVLMSADLFYQTRRDQMVALAQSHKVPVMWEWPDFVAAGGLASYSANTVEIHMQLGIYVGRILNGTDPADLPVIQSSRFELAINRKTANALGLSIPSKLLFTADTVIE
jgi:putative ABC transport system substrate-binding protein